MVKTLSANLKAGSLETSTHRVTDVKGSGIKSTDVKGSGTKGTDIKDSGIKSTNVKSTVSIPASSAPEKVTLSDRDKRYREMSLSAPMYKVVLTIGAPLALYQSLSQVFSILDTMMASHISPESVSAVAYLAQLNFILSALGGGLAVGAGIQISRAYGEGNFPLVKKRVSTIYVLCLTLGILLLALILPFTEGFLRFAGTPDGLIQVGSQYFRVQLITLVVTFLNNVYIAVERARGNSKRILKLNMIVIVTKLSLTAVFVYVLKSGLVMIAVASMISQILLLVFAVWNSRDKENVFGFSLSAISFSKEVNAPIFSNSIPVIAEKMLFAFGKTKVNSMCTVYGDLMVGAMGVSNNLGGITTNPQNGFQEGTSAIVSQNLGAKKYERVLSAFYWTLVVNMLIGAVISSLTILFSPQLSHLFDGGDETFRQMIMLVYRYEALGAVPLGANAAVLAFLYGLGKTKLSMLINVSRVFVFRIPVFYFLQHFTDYGEASVGIVMMVSNISVAVMAVIVAAIVIHNFKKEYLNN